MNQFQEFFKDLFSTRHWPARWHCGKWSDFHGWMYIISDLMIWLAYFAIPVIIISYTYRKQYELKYTKTYILFASFILLCGSTHLLDAAMFWTPMYRFNALVRLITGVVSLFTVYHLFKILPSAFKEKTSVVLEREIQKREDAERRLAEANEGLKAFAYMASHDLQEPLRKINIFSTQLHEENANRLDERSVELTRKIMATGQRMGVLIKDILSLSSIADDTPMAEVDLNATLRQAVAELEGNLQQRNGTLQIETLPVIKGNDHYLVQLFINLIGNAIKFNQNPPEISVSARSGDNEVYIYVKDNGIGIPADQREKVFQAFHRLHPKHAFEGTGIGLAICKRIVDVHGGRIAVQSQDDQGTTFEITFPKA